MQVVTGLSWQPSCAPEHTYRSFRLDGTTAVLSSTTNHPTRIFRHLRTFHTASPTRTSATGPYRCAVARNTGGATDAPKYSKDSPRPKKPQRPLLRSVQMIADPAATPINPISGRMADQYGARVEVSEASGIVMKSTMRAIEQQTATSDAMARWLTGNLLPRTWRRYCLAIQATQNATDAPPP